MNRDGIMVFSLVLGLPVAKPLPRRCKFAKLVPYHLLCNRYWNMILAIMYKEFEPRASKVIQIVSHHSLSILLMGLHCHSPYKVGKDSARSSIGPNGSIVL